MLRPSFALSLFALALLVGLIAPSAPDARANSPITVEPTAFDQYMLELVNRARSDPDAEAAFFGIDLNEGLAPGTLTNEPREPLAWNLCVVDAAQKHTAHLLAEFTDLPPDHRDKQGRDPTARVTDAGGTFIGGVAENNAWTTQSKSTKLFTSSVDKMHLLLFKDFTDTFEVIGRGHRRVMLNGTRNEVGVGTLPGVFGGGKDAAVCTIDLITTNQLCVTGVAYVDDVDVDRFYTPDEGLGGVTVVAVRQSDSATFQTTTMTAGGYSLPVDPGTYEVTASGGGLPSPIVVPGIVVVDENRKVDFIAARADDPPPTPAFELAKAKAKLSGSTGLWKLTVKKTVYQPGFVAFGGEVSSLAVQVNGTSYFTDLATATVKEKTNDQGQLTKLTIKDALKNKIKLDFKKSKMTMTLKNAPGFDPTAGPVTIEVSIGGTVANVTAGVTVTGSKLNKATLTPTTGTMTSP